MVSAAVVISVSRPGTTELRDSNSCLFLVSLYGLKHLKGNYLHNFLLISLLIFRARHRSWGVREEVSSVVSGSL
jgi:hypothetical protein